MLIKTRKPGPRAKKTDLPTVHYGTVRSGTPLSLGMTISYRFYEKHVYSIAKIVHGDVERHMAIKRNQRAERSDKKRRNVRRELKVQYHADLVEAFSVSEGDVEVKDHHRKRMLSHLAAKPTLTLLQVSLITRALRTTLTTIPNLMAKCMMIFTTEIVISTR